MNGECNLASRQSCCGHRVDFLNACIALCVATDLSTSAVHHQVVAGSPLRPIIGVCKPQVEAKVISAIRIHLSATCTMETLRSLLVAVPKFWARLAGSVRIGQLRDNSKLAASRSTQSSSSRYRLKMRMKTGLPKGNPNRASSRSNCGRTRREMSCARFKPEDSECCTKVPMAIRPKVVNGQPGFQDSVGATAGHTRVQSR